VLREERLRDPDLCRMDAAVDGCPAEVPVYAGPSSGKGVAAGTGVGGTYTGFVGPGPVTGSARSAGFTTRATTRITSPPARTGIISFHSIPEPPETGSLAEMFVARR